MLLFIGHEFVVRAKCVINATGPYTDFVREMDSPNQRKICQPSSGKVTFIAKLYVGVLQTLSIPTQGLLQAQSFRGPLCNFAEQKNRILPPTKHVRQLSNFEKYLFLNIKI